LSLATGKSRDEAYPTNRAAKLKAPIKYRHIVYLTSGERLISPWSSGVPKYVAPRRRLRCPRLLPRCGASVQFGTLARQGSYDKPVAIALTLRNRRPAISVVMWSHADRQMTTGDFVARAREPSEFFRFRMWSRGRKIEQGNYKNLIIANRPYYWNHSNFMRLARRNIIFSGRRNTTFFRFGGVSLSTCFLVRSAACR
jgi:hypothetical protein